MQDNQVFKLDFSFPFPISCSSLFIIYHFSTFKIKILTKRTHKKTKKGFGAGTRPTAASSVKVHYHGTLPDGTVFDSSLARGDPATFALGQVIPGWKE